MGLHYLQIFRASFSKKYSMLAKLSLPNKITLMRIFLVPLLVGFLVNPSPASSLMAALIFSAASFTDWLDGYLARSKGQITILGKLLDPVADKILIMAALIPLVEQGRVSAWMAVLLLGREFAVMGLRAVAVVQGTIIAASPLGKYKMGLETAAVLFLILSYNELTVSLGTLTLYSAAFVSIVSGADYFLKFYREEELGGLPQQQP